jgi:hypothetical protein
MERAMRGRPRKREHRAEFDIYCTPTQKAVLLRLAADRDVSVGQLIADHASLLAAQRLVASLSVA